MRIIVVLVFIFVVVPLMYEVAGNNRDLNNAKKNLAALQENERVINIENEQLRRYSDGENFDEYIERYARDVMGFADPNERVYYIVPGN
jgi:cell division protein FtsB